MYSGGNKILICMFYGKFTLNDFINIRELGWGLIDKNGSKGTNIIFQEDRRKDIVAGREGTGSSS